MGVGAPPHCSLGAVACHLLFVYRWGHGVAVPFNNADMAAILFAPNMGRHLPLHPSRDLGYANPTPAAAPASAVNSASGTSYYTPASSVRDAVSPEVSRENSLAEGGERGGAAAESAPPPPPPVEAPGCQALYVNPVHSGAPPPACAYV